MTTLGVTLRGQVTFRKELLRHLGIAPGGKIHVDLLPDGRVEIRGARPTGTFHDLHGFLKGKTNGARLTIEEIGEVIAESGAKAGMGSD